MDLDFTGKILENSIKYLYEISKLVPNNVPAMKSYCASKSRILELKGNLYLPSKLTKDSVRCTRCCLNYSDYPPNIQLKPKRRMTRFSRRVQKKIDENKPITIFQQNFAKKLKTLGCGKVVKICQICKKETGTPVKYENNNKIEIDLTASCTPKVPKKKKRKDKFCGLTPNAVLSVEKPKSKPILKVPNVKPTVATILNKIKEQEIDREQENNCKITKKKKKEMMKKIVQDKIIEKKKLNTQLKSKNKLNNLLGNLNKAKGKPQNVLKNFLDAL